MFSRSEIGQINLGQNILGQQYQGKSR